LPAEAIQNRLLLSEKNVIADIAAGLAFELIFSNNQELGSICTRIYAGINYGKQLIFALCYSGKISLTALPDPS
jgi:hypothetical protein